MKALLIILAVFSGYVFYVTRADAFIYAALFFVVGVLLVFFGPSRFADEVYDCGDFLLVKRGKKSEELSLANIQKVTSAKMKGSAIITLFLIAPGAFGKKIAFIVSSSYRLTVVGAFKTHPLAEDLTRRVRQAQAKR
ncbi:hypothetical protein AGMMS49545_20170 [Betaproteobacteria bacterium]|nr:hypothetical protein AGMMS49545_20170 [Betaproteobacteria bacterium]GHU39907.1 hypothetical protein AGMMS50289_00530 [Betaproteobacteria bacterium]